MSVGPSAAIGTAEPGITKHSSTQKLRVSLLSVVSPKSMTLRWPSESRSATTRAVASSRLVSVVGRWMIHRGAVIAALGCRVWSGHIGG